MRQCYRPYSLAIAVADPTVETAVTLKDTGGNELLCNYVSVQVSGTAGNFVRISIVPDGLTQPNYSTAAGMVGVTTSGVPSVFTTQGGGPAELVLSDQDRTSTIYIQGQETNSAVFIVTYGQVGSANPARDNLRTRGT